MPYYEYALDTILDVEMPRDAALTEDQQDSIEAAAELLYGLIHARYILTPRGMNAMVDKFENMQFGRCPRVLCQGQAVLPVGQSDLPRTHTCKIFCPKCARSPRRATSYRAAPAAPPRRCAPHTRTCPAQVRRDLLPAPVAAHEHRWRVLRNYVLPPLPADALGTRPRACAARYGRDMAEIRARPVRLYDAMMPRLQARKRSMCHASSGSRSAVRSPSAGMGGGAAPLARREPARAEGQRKAERPPPNSRTVPACAPRT